MPNVAELIDQGKAHHRAGQLPAAAECYRQALALEPAEAEGAYLLGTVCLALGDLDQAVTLLAQATVLRPRHADIHHQLGVALARRGDLPQSAEALGRALSLKPDNAQWHVDIGRVRLTDGLVDSAVQHFKRALAFAPHHPEALCCLASVLLQQANPDQAAHCLCLAMEVGAKLGAENKLDEAVSCFRQVIAATPHLPDAHHNLAFVLNRQDKLDEAAAGYRRAIELRPNYAEAYTNLCIVLRQQQKLVEAEAAARRGLELLGDDAMAHFNLGTVLADRDQSTEAIATFQRALEIDPRCSQAHNNLGVMLYRLNQYEEGLHHSRQAVEIDANHAGSRVSLATGLLTLGRFVEAWPHYEWRLHDSTHTHAQRHLPQPRWDGSPPAGRTILLRCEQGYGDSLQFIRYASLLKQQGATVLVQGPSRLLALLASCPGVDGVVADEDPVPRFDCHLPLMSLPSVLDPTLANIPTAIPYLTPDARLVERWRDELRDKTQGEPALRVGIAWQGRPAQFNDRFRSIPLARFAGLARVAGARLYSLQKGRGSEQLAEVAGQLPIVDLGKQLGDFHNTAAIVRNLDLVITCDSAPAHLAGALGLPVWLALPWSPDWRWMLERKDSPWYPTMRLFRQPSAGDWETVFGQLEAALAEAVAERGGK